MRTLEVGARGNVGVKREIHGALETKDFRAEHRAVRIARRDGDTERVYPYGTFAAVAFGGAPVQDEPPPNAIVTAPGPTLGHAVAASGAGGDEGETLDYGSALGLGSLFASVWSSIRGVEPMRAAGTLCGAQIVLDLHRDQHGVATR